MYYTSVFQVFYDVVVPELDSVTLASLHRLGTADEVYNYAAENQQHWITILLDGSVSEAKVLDFLDMSYDLIDGAGGKEENVSGLQ